MSLLSFDTPLKFEEHLRLVRNWQRDQSTINFSYIERTNGTTHKQERATLQHAARSQGDVSKADR